MEDFNQYKKVLSQELQRIRKMRKEIEEQLGIAQKLRIISTEELLKAIKVNYDIFEALAIATRRKMLAIKRLEVLTKQLKFYVSKYRELLIKIIKKEQKEKERLMWLLPLLAIGGILLPKNGYSNSKARH